jgi:hypothetical protein
MVGIMLVAFVGVGAIAADIGRFYVVTSEVQTAADATAIEGGRKLMLTPGSNPIDSVAADVVPWVAANQRANMTALSTAADAVETLFYTPGANGGTLSATLPGQRPNAVRITLQSTPKGFFAQLLGNSGTRLLKRRATAWVASLGSNCVRPWSFPYDSLYHRVMNTPATPPNTGLLDMAKFTTFVSQATSQRMFTFLGQNTGTIALPNDGEWTGFNYTGNKGKPSFVDGFEPCTSVSPWYLKKLNFDAGDGVLLPGQAGNYVTWANTAIPYGTGKGQSKGTTTGICDFRDPSNTADCYDPTTSSGGPGITINSAWGENVSQTRTVFKYVGEFQMLCYFQTLGDKCSSVSGKYPPGTVVGYVRAIKSRMITLGDSLGNFTSGVQTIVLVR